MVIQALEFKPVGPQNQCVDMMFFTPHSLDFGLPGYSISHSSVTPQGPPVSDDISATAVKAVPLHLTKTPVHKSSHM
jgi:hypothetical protein